MDRPMSEFSGAAKCRNNVHFLQVPEQLWNSRIQVHAVDETLFHSVWLWWQTFHILIISLRREHRFVWVVCSVRCLCSTWTVTQWAENFSWRSPILSTKKIRAQNPQLFPQHTWTNGRVAQKTVKIAGDIPFRDQDRNLTLYSGTHGPVIRRS